MSSKTLYLIRHAESMQNVAVKRFANNPWNIAALGPIIGLGHDAKLSELGERQLIPANEFLKKNAWNPKPGTSQPQLIVHSPHTRTKQTCMGVFNGCECIPVLELHCLYERTVFEYVNIRPLDSRIAQTEEWLCSRKENVIVLVGHGQYFRRWLNLDYTQNNVEVLECSWHVTEGNKLKDKYYLDSRNKHRIDSVI
jgi:phosphohistidine phosphatase SixA